MRMKEFYFSAEIFELPFPCFSLVLLICFFAFSFWYHLCYIYLFPWLINYLFDEDDGDDIKMIHSLYSPPRIFKRIEWIGKAPHS